MKKLFFAPLLLGLTVMGSTCVYASGWQKDSVGWWYSLPNGGYYRNTWFYDYYPDYYDSKWYYFNNDGYMVANQWVGDYYLGSDGAMYKSRTTPDGYYVNYTGAWMPNTNNLSGLTGKFRFYLNSGSINILEWNGDVLHIGGSMYREATNENLGYTEEWVRINDNSTLYLCGGGGDSKVSKDIFKSRVEARLHSLDQGESIILEVHNGEIINACLCVSTD
jgi:cell wall binding repeat family protein